MMPNMMYGMESWWLIGMALMLLFWIAAILLVIWGVRSLFPKQSASPRVDPLETLRQRYAAGEMDAGEYERAPALLEQTPVA